jgi:LCP family protein required for cell wall assembly
VANDLPAIPGRQRSVYTASRKRLFGRRRSHVPSFGGGSGRGGRGTSSHGRRWPKRVIIGLISLVLLLLVVSVGSYLYIDSKLGGITRVPVSGLTPVQAGQPIDILLIGSDSRKCEKSSQSSAFGSQTTVTGERSDTIIVARLLGGSRVEMLSIPRDTWVPIAGTSGSNKINAAFNNGAGPLVQTIQDNFHIPINHVIMVNFCGFPAMVNSLGGVYMDFKYPVKDGYSGLSITQTGCQLVNGTQALALVRSRHLFYLIGRVWHYDGQSDFSRIKRQQAFFHALLDRVHQVVPNVFRLSSFVGATVGGLAVDSGYSSSEMINIGWDYHSLGQSDLFTSLLPTTESVIDGEDVLLPAKSNDEVVISAFLAGNVGTFQSALGLAPHRVYLTQSSVVTGNFEEPWNPLPC